MNLQLLIDSVVRQTTVLIAQLATAGGTRAPLAHVANQVFLELVGALDEQGVSRKVGADMFGMALRTYQRKIQRLAESSTDRGRSLWEAIFEFLEEKEIATRRQVFARFHRDDDQLVRGVLHDLTETGLIFASGAGEATAYRVVTSEELSRVRDGSSPEDAASADTLLWALIYREGPLSREELARRLTMAEPELEAALERLLTASRIERDTRGTYRCHELVVPYGSTAGWEGAVFDHFQAVVKTICMRLRAQEAPLPKNEVGGSTYTFVVWPEHPLAAEVRGGLAGYRSAADSLRARVDAYNAEHGIPARHQKVVAYAGQCVVDEEPGD